MGGTQLKPSLVAEYSAGLLLVGPLVWLVGMAAAVRAIRQRARETLLLICTAVPVILFLAFRCCANWPAFAYFPFSILVAHYDLRCAPGWRHGLLVASAALSLSLALVATLQARFGILALGRYAPRLAATETTNGVHGWREFGGTEALRHSFCGHCALPSTLGAEITYYTAGQPPSATADGTRPSQFNLLKAPDPEQTKNRLYVWSDADAPFVYSRHL